MSTLNLFSYNTKEDELLSDSEGVYGAILGARGVMGNGKTPFAETMAPLSRFTTGVEGTVRLFTLPVDGTVKLFIPTVRTFTAPLIS